MLFRALILEFYCPEAGPSSIPFSPSILEVSCSVWLFFGEHFLLDYNNGIFNVSSDFFFNKHIIPTNKYISIDHCHSTQTVEEEVSKIHFINTILFEFFPFLFPLFICVITELVVKAWSKEGRLSKYFVNRSLRHIQTSSFDPSPIL